MGTNRTAVLGVSCDFHDAAAALLVDGRLVAAAEQERFSRRKHDRRLPVDAIRWALDHGAVGPGDLEAVAFYEKPLSSIRAGPRHPRTRVGPSGVAGALADAVSSWSRSKAWIGYRLERITRRDRASRARQVVFLRAPPESRGIGVLSPPFEHAAVLTIDGVGEWSTASVRRRTRQSKIAISEEMRFPIRSASSIRR
jgi:carbamoyltransferase